MKIESSSLARKAAMANVVPAMLFEFGKLPDDAYIGVRSVAALFDAGISTIWARSARGELPKPRKFGRSTRWRVGDIRSILARAPC